MQQEVLYKRNIRTSRDNMFVAQQFIKVIDGEVRLYIRDGLMSENPPTSMRLLGSLALKECLRVVQY